MVLLREPEIPKIVVVSKLKGAADPSGFKASQCNGTLLPPRPFKVVNSGSGGNLSSQHANTFSSTDTSQV